jgi:hypothetical protein
LFRNAALSTRPAADNAVLADALLAGGLTSQKRPARSGRTIWRFLMASRLTKLTAAVILIAAALLGVHYLNGTVVKAVEFSEIIKAMQQVSWMHATVTGFERRPGGSDEHWVGFESRIQATKRANGNAIFMSEKNHQQWEYDPNSDTITISHLEAFPIDLPSPAMILTTIHKLFEQEGAQVVVKMGSHGGRKVQVQDIALSNVATGQESQTLTLYVDSDSKLVYGAEVKAIDAAGNVVGAGTMTYDYLPSDPQSIYDLGVPRDARLVDKTPSADFSAVWEEYRWHKAEAADEYIAVIVHQEKSPSEVVRMLDVDYRSGRKERHERYFLSPSGEAIAELGPAYREQLGSSLEPLLAWARRRYEDPGVMLSIHLYDGQYYNSIDREGKSGWGELNRAYSPTGDIELSQTVAYQAWPTMPSTARIVTDDYARQNGLICIENLTQGQVLPQGMVGHPGRFLYYLDPTQDYLCRRHGMEWRPDADWQQDKTWLKSVDPKKVGGGGMVVWEIPEVFQAPNGHWYPKVIVQRQTEAREDYRSAPLKVYDVETIYLDLSPTFPEGIFDPQKLPGQ